MLTMQCSLSFISLEKGSLPPSEILTGMVARCGLELRASSCARQSMLARNGPKYRPNFVLVVAHSQAQSGRTTFLRAGLSICVIQYFNRNFSLRDN